MSPPGFSNDQAPKSRSRQTSCKLTPAECQMIMKQTERSDAVAASQCLWIVLLWLDVLLPVRTALSTCRHSCAVQVTRILQERTKKHHSSLSSLTVAQFSAMHYHTFQSKHYKGTSTTACCYSRPSLIFRFSFVLPSVRPSPRYLEVRETFSQARWDDLPTSLQPDGRETIDVFLNYALSGPYL